jgi:hypothetical protein
MANRKLTAEDRKAIREQRAAGATLAALARMFGVSAPAIGNVCRAPAPAPAPAPAVVAPPIGRRVLARPEYRSDFATLGAMKSDPVERVDWLHRALSISAQHIVADPDYPGDEVARRKELRDTARALAHCTPASLIARVLELIQADADGLDDGPGAGGPDREPRAPGANAYASLMAAPRRGRPRKV